MAALFGYPEGFPLLPGFWGASKEVCWRSTKMGATTAVVKQGDAQNNASLGRAPWYKRIQISPCRKVTGCREGTESCRGRWWPGATTSLLHTSPILCSSTCI